MNEICELCRKPAYAVFEWRVTGKGLQTAMFCRDCAMVNFGKGGDFTNHHYRIKQLPSEVKSYESNP